MTSKGEAVIADVDASDDNLETKELKNNTTKSVEEANEDVTAEEAVAEVEEVANDEEEETKDGEQDEEDVKETNGNDSEESNEDDKDVNDHKENGKEVMETTNGDSKKRAATDTVEPEVELKKMKAAAGDSESSQVEVATGE